MGEGKVKKGVEIREGGTETKEKDRREGDEEIEREGRKEGIGIRNLKRDTFTYMNPSFS